jgi:group I intron endonuclease
MTTVPNNFLPSKDKISGVYVIKNNANGLFYIGGTNNIKTRKVAHFSALRNNRHNNKSLQEDFNKYGITYFEFDVIIYCKIRDIEKIEKHYIKHTKAFQDGVGYNRSTNTNTAFRRSTRDKRVKSCLMLHPFCISMADKKMKALLKKKRIPRLTLSRFIEMAINDFNAE